MHSALKKAAETKAAVDTAEAVAAIAPELAAINERLDRIESLLRDSSKSSATPQQSKGGR